MNLIRKVAWTVLLGASSLLGTSGSTGSLPPQAAAGKATEEGCWLFEEEPDDPFGLDDEFEGEGWSFWGD